MSETAPAITRFTFERGELRGTQLSLFPACLVHRSDNYLETLPLGGVTAVRVAFQRDTRKLGWGIALVVAALLMLAIAGPISSFASSAANDMASAGAQGVPRALYSFFRTLEAPERKSRGAQPEARVVVAIHHRVLGVVGERVADAVSYTHLTLPTN